MAAQTVLPAADVAIGASLKFFGQGLGGAVLVSSRPKRVEHKADIDLTGVPNLGPRVIVSVWAIKLRTLCGGRKY